MEPDSFRDDESLMHGASGEDACSEHSQKLWTVYQAICAVKDQIAEQCPLQRHKYLRLEQHHKLDHLHQDQDTHDRELILVLKTRIRHRLR